MAKANVRLPKTLRSDFDLDCRYNGRQQFHAILIKNFKLLSTAWCGLLASFLVPLILMALLVFLHFYYLQTYKDSNGAGDVITSSEYKVLSTLSQGSMGNVTYYADPASVSYSDLGMIGPASDSPSTGKYFSLLNSKDYSGFRTSYSLKNESSIMIPYIAPVQCANKDAKNGCVDTIDSEIGQYMTTMIHEFADLDPKDDTGSDSNTKRMITHHLTYKDIAFSNKKLLFSNKIKVGQDYILNTYLSNQTAVPIISSIKTHYRLMSAQFLLSTLMYGQSTNEIFVDAKDKNTIPVPKMDLSFGSYWVSTGDTKPDPYTPLFSMFLIPFSFLILLPIFTYSHSNDRGEGLNNLHFMMGLKYKNLFFGNFVYQFIICITFSILMALMTMLGDLEAVSKNTPIAWIFDFILFSLNIPLLSLYVGCWMESGKTASIVSIFVSLVYAICGVAGGSHYSGLDIEDKSMSFGYSFIPAFSPIVIMNELCAVACMQDEYQYIRFSDLRLLGKLEPGARYTTRQYLGQSITQNIIVGFFMTLFWGAFGFYLDQIVPRRHGVPEHPLFPFKSLVKRLDIVKKYLKIQQYVELARVGDEVSSQQLPIDEDDSEAKGLTETKKSREYIHIPYSVNDDSRGGVPFSEEELRIRSGVALEVVDRQGLTLTIEKINERLSDSHNYAILSATNVFRGIGCFFAHPKLMTMRVNYFTKFGVFLAIHNQQRISVDASNESNTGSSSSKLGGNINCIGGNDKQAMVDLANQQEVIGDEIIGKEQMNYVIGGATAAVHGGVQLQQLFSEYSQSTSEYVGKNGIGHSRYGKTRKALENISNAFEPNSIDDDVAVEKANTEACKLASNGGEPLVRVLGMKKTYKGTRTSPPKNAVKGIWLTVGENECLGLLGSNGAGKTTLLNMLCMSFKPTAGTGYINGYDVTNPASRSLIQSCLGVCPQFDIHWPTLSCAEHLRFFCRLKGVPKKYQEEHIMDLLNAVGLGTQAKVPSKSLSGGMRRRLSVAISLCGKPKVLLLDEPSTGLDPENRCGLWNIILACRPGRATIITSHAMEEVVALCTRVTITADGRLRCIGTIPHLQSKFGTGYQLGIHVDMASLASDMKGHDELSKMIDYDINDYRPLTVGSIVLTNPSEKAAHQKLTESINGLKLVSAYYGALTYAVPITAKISDIFSIMERMIREKATGICDWSISQTSLESIFVRIVNESRV